MRALSVLVGLAAVFAFGSILNNADDIDGRVPNTVVSAEPDLGPATPTLDGLRAQYLWPALFAARSNQ